jgi:hypothetical protein
MCRSPPGGRRGARRLPESGEELAAADPGNVMWQTDLVVSHYKMAVASEAKRENLAEALSILRRLDAAGTL